ncbi:iporin isoform X2 [Denticeps clupeoides]|uniref:iporin isoform X2 n=1 Tax=Denticeps clupeoides TaxID=299321 RepID=UPI0010A4FC66|nr:iporin-like isoform X2 [Denticeps clupeoides]
MNSPPKLSGETLIVHHIPLVHCQVSGSRQCFGSMKQGHPFSPPENLGLSRTTSLPERDVLPREALVYSSLIQTSSCNLSSSDVAVRGGEEEELQGGRAECRGREGYGGSTASDTSFTSSNSEDHISTTTEAQTLKRSYPLRHNPFLLNTEEDEDDDEEDHDDGDNLHRYMEDSSFHLHGTGNEVAVPPFHLHDLDFAQEPFLLHGTLGKPWCSSECRRTGTESSEGLSEGAFHLSSGLEGLSLLGLDSQRRHGSSGSTLSMDCGEQEWGEDEEEEDHPMRCGRASRQGSSSGSSSAAPRCSCFPDCQMGYGSDSSCNSSDGVLVNFSTIYNKMNNVVPANLNSSAEPPGTASVTELAVGGGGTSGGAFYLDMHTSPTEVPQSTCAGIAPASQETPDSAPSCGCPAQQQGIMDLDANCNSYLSSEGLLSATASANDLTSCLQSHARMVVATQNYYKLVTCDLSSQSSPSPAGSSVTSCSDEHSKGSPTQPTEYYLFRQTKEEEDGEEDEEDGDEDDTSLSQDEDEEKARHQTSSSDPEENVLEGQVYVNISPPLLGQVMGGAAGRPRSRSYDRDLDKSPSPRLGSLERMLSCPVRLSEGAAPSPPPPARVTSFAEIARNKRRCGAAGGSPSLRMGNETSSTQSQSSTDFSPILEDHQERRSQGLSHMTRCYSQSDAALHSHHNGALRDSPGGLGCETRTKAEGGLSSSSEAISSVVRYSKDQRPTTLPIQPFTFQHQFSRPQNKPLLPLLNEFVSHMQGRGSAPPEGRENEAAGEQQLHQPLADAPTSVRPSPLGSYSPVRFHGAPSSGSCSTCSPSPPERGAGSGRPPRSFSCPISAGLLPAQTPPEVQARAAPLPPTPPPPPGIKKSPRPLVLPSRAAPCLHMPSLPTLPSSGLCSLGPLQPVHHEGLKNLMPACGGVRPANVHHLSPQALKWREYRRRNPLGVERGSSSSSAPLSGSLDTRRRGGRVTRRNVFDFPSAGHTLGRINAQSVRQPPQHYSDFLPDYFSQTERPPEEFCLSPDASSDESFSIDLLQKRGLVKAINTAVDLIVAHFGTSRDPGVKAKLGNSSVSPNVGHLILKYLCPAIQDILQDGLKAYVLDLIIGQRRNQPWSIVEASTQLGPSTRVLNSLFCKVNQYSELSSHNMRFNAFIFGLLNLRSLEFWFNHIYTHEDIVAAHYHPWGFLPLSQGVCQPLFEELLLLLQPLSLLPFDLDLLFEPHLLQKGQEHLRRKEQLCSSGQVHSQSARSTFQLMRGWGITGVESKIEGAGTKQDVKGGLRHPGTWQNVEGSRSLKNIPERRRQGAGCEAGGEETSVTEIIEGSNEDLWRHRDAGRKGGVKATERAKGVGGEWHSNEEEGSRDRRKEREKDRDSGSTDPARQRNRQAGWWYQLMQSSQVYIDNSVEGSKFVKWEKRKRPGGEGRRQSHPPPREGVVEGAEASQKLEEADTRSAAGAEASKAAKGRPSWMGSPPESVLSELKKSEERDPEAVSGPQADGPEESSLHGMRWGRLFGAGAPARAEKPEHRSARCPKSRLPSGWLSLDRSVLDLVAQTVGAGKRNDPLPVSSQSEAPPTTQQALAAQQQAPCEVRALCHHIATEPGHLSFHKGDVLCVTSRADPDWLVCTLGESQGLVPIIYVTLNEENRGLRGPH